MYQTYHTSYIRHGHGLGYDKQMIGRVESFCRKLHLKGATKKAIRDKTYKFVGKANFGIFIFPRGIVGRKAAGELLSWFFQLNTL